MHRTALLLTLVAATVVPLSGCDLLGIETASQVAAKKEAEGKAIGSACRHAVRSVEDCFRSNPKAGKAAVFDGWKEMDAYMRENEIVGMPYTPPAEVPGDAPATGAEAPSGGSPSEPRPGAAQRS
jgi:hypothetical protein